MFLDESIDDLPMWLRLTAVAERRGVDSRTLLTDITAGRFPVRMRRMGDRGLLYLLTADVLQQEAIELAQPTGVPL